MTKPNSTFSHLFTHFASALGVLLCASSAAAQVPTAPKDAGVATVIGFVFPGGGQYYSEAMGKGLLYTSAVAASVGIGAALSRGDEYTKDLVTVPVTAQNPLGLELRDRLVRKGDRTPMVAGATLGGIVWLLAALDAPNDARRANARRVSTIVTPNRVGLALTF